MPVQQVNSPAYKFLYQFLAVLDGSQVHKLHKIVSGLLDVSVFSKDEIDILEKRLAGARNRNYNDGVANSFSRA